MQTKCPFFSSLTGEVSVAVICLAILFISFCQSAVLSPGISDQHFDNSKKAHLLVCYSLQISASAGVWKFGIFGNNMTSCLPETGAAIVPSFFFNGFFQGPVSLLEQKRLQHERSLLSRGPPVPLMCSCHNCLPVLPG